MIFNVTNFYKSKQWEDLVEVLKLERLVNGEIVCEHCHKPIVKKYDCIAHHKVELTEANVNDYSVSLNPSNVMLIHFGCHNKIHERFGYERPKKIYIVYGSPCSGKSTWVNSVATKDDLILDMDSIWQCISGGDKYSKSNRLKANVFGVRDCILDQVKCRVGKFKNAYIIGGYPLKMERQRLCDTLGAELIYIEASRDECLSRAKNVDWVGYVNEWFDMYQE